MILTETTLQKVETVIGNTADRVVDLPLKPLNPIIDKTEKLLDSPILSKLKKRIYTDPSKQSRLENSKEWATLMGAGSIGSHIPQLIQGSIDPSTLLGLAASNAAKGAVIGPMLSGGRDSLLKSTAIPAAVMAGSTYLVNQAGEGLGYDNIDYSPESRAGLTAGVSGGMWALRNRKNNNKIYI